MNQAFLAFLFLYIQLDNILYAAPMGFWGLMFLHTGFRYAAGNKVFQEHYAILSIREALIVVVMAVG